MLAARYDRDRSFLLAEIAGDTLFFQAVSRQGGVIDKGFVVRREVSQPVALAQPARTP